MAAVSDVSTCSGLAAAAGVTVEVREDDREAHAGHAAEEHLRGAVATVYRTLLDRIIVGFDHARTLHYNQLC